MARWDEVGRQHVLRAVEEYDSLGQEEFLDRYGFGRATGYLLVVDGQTYDSKAIAGVAHGFATGEALGSDAFSGGKDGAARVLRGLGFEVTGPEGTAVPSTAGTVRVDDGSPVVFADALNAWAAPARDRLVQTARDYHATVTYKELAAYVQQQTGIRTGMLLSNWIGTVLGKVSEECAARGEPLLSSLCVNQEGSVGEGYAPAVAALRGDLPADGDLHAAQERLDCYRHFGATLPEDGGHPSLTPLLRRRREWHASRARAEQAPAVCPKHFLQLSVTGACPECEF